MFYVYYLANIFLSLTFDHKILISSYLSSKNAFLAILTHNPLFSEYKNKRVKGQGAMLAQKHIYQFPLNTYTIDRAPFLYYITD